jgi:hypothetical protein
MLIEEKINAFVVSKLFKEVYGSNLVGCMNF